MNLKINLIPNFAIIGVDINKSLNDEQRKSIRDDFISKLSKDDVIIKSGSRGLHIYCVHDIASVYLWSLSFWYIIIIRVIIINFILRYCLFMIIM